MSLSGGDEPCWRVGRQVTSPLSIDPSRRDAVGASVRGLPARPRPRPRPVLCQPLNFGPGEGADCDDVSAAVSAQQEMLSASPLPVGRKWGSLLLAAGLDLVSGPTPSTPLPQGLRVQSLAGADLAGGKPGLSTGRGPPSLGTPSIRRGP